jgi:tRNA(Ile)-lysidine synthase
VQVSKDALTREHLEEMLSLIRSENTNAVITLPAGVLFHMERDELFFTIGGEEELARTDIHAGENILPNECGVFVVSTSPITQDTFPTLNVYRNLIYSSVNSATIKGSLYVRAKMDGDSYCYGGMTHKVKRLFSDKKLPLSLRKKWPILCDDAGILWVPGFSVRDSINDETHKFYFCYGYNMEDQK